LFSEAGKRRKFLIDFDLIRTNCKVCQPGKLKSGRKAACCNMFGDFLKKQRSFDG